MSSGRVLWVSTSLDTRGGISSYVRTLRDSPLWRVWTIEHIASHREGSAAVRIGAFARAGARFVLALTVRRPDLVHLHTASAGSFVRKATLFWVARALRVPVVLHVHGGGFADFYRRSGAPLRWLIRATLTRADVVVALGERWARRLHAIAPAARITAIGNAVQISEPACAPDAWTPADVAAVHVLFLGEIGDGKGAFTLLAAWAQALVGRPPGTARLTLAGNGALHRARDTVARLNLTGTVAVPGWVPAGQVPGLLRSAQVLALPSLDEGQPMAVIEAMAHGLCVVASDVGGIPDLVEDGRTGLLVPPGEVAALAAALRRVLDDADLREHLGRAALTHARATLDVAVVWRRFDALYRELLATRTRRPPQLPSRRA